jgi:hypothetical protein
MVINDALRSMWMEANVTYFKALSQNISGDTEENQEEPPDYRPTGR